jgi:hypothetical protein
MTAVDWLLEQIAADEEFFAAYDMEESFRRRVLAECAAKRRIVELHQPTAMLVELTEPGRRVPVCQTCGYPDDKYGTEWPCGTLRILAQPYADRPGFPDEWRSVAEQIPPV